MNLTTWQELVHKSHSFENMTTLVMLYVSDLLKKELVHRSHSFVNLAALVMLYVNDSLKE